MLRMLPVGLVAVRFIVRLSVVILACSLLVQVQGHAVAISKSVLYFDAKPNTTQEKWFTIENNEARKIAVRIRLVDWDDTPDGRTLILPPNTIARSCASWIQYAPQAFELLPGQERDIRVTVSAAASSVGTYWAAFLVDNPMDLTSASQGQIRARTQYLIKVYQTSLPASTSGKITRVVVNGLNPLWVTLKFNNTGETLMRDVNATATLQDSTGQTLGTFSSAPFSVLPGHVVDVSIASPLYMQIPGVYLITVVVDYGADYLIAGQVALRIKPLALTPIGASAGPPQDLDGDGLYEDINGDGRLSEDDLKLFENNLDDSCIKRNVRAFDYSNDGRVGEDDVDLLRDMISRQPAPSGGRG